MLELLSYKNSVPLFFGLSLEKFINYNWAFGLKFSVQFLLTLVILLCALLAIVYFYILSIFYIPVKAYTRFSLTLIAAGMVSNLVDRLQKSHVVDFISFKMTQNISFHFNTADIIQTIGLIMLLFIIFKNRSLIWRLRETRQFFKLVLKQDQIHLIAYISITLTLFSMFFILMNYLFIDSIYSLMQAEPNQASYAFLVYSLFALIFYVIPISIITSMYFTKQIYGPIYAFDRYVREFLQGNNSKEFKLRQNDRLKEVLESLAAEIKNKK